MSPLVLVIGFTIILVCTLLVTALLLNIRAPHVKVGRPQTPDFWEREKDVAAALGIEPDTWMTARIAATVIGLLVGLWSGILVFSVVLLLAAFFGFKWAFAGRASKRRLRMERSFVQQLRVLRDRISISNQSLDIALQELGRNPPKELNYVFLPLARGGSVVQNIVEMGRRSRSPVIEHACGVLILARTRSLDALIEAIDQVLLEVSEAQLAVEEESLVTLSQQRAVTVAMLGLMGIMFFAVVRVDTFRSYYQSFIGQMVLLVVIAMFAFLVWVLGRIVRVEGWTRWNLQQLAREQDRMNA